MFYCESRLNDSEKQFTLHGKRGRICLICPHHEHIYSHIDDLNE